jgi:hypothetical protein
VAGTCAYLEHPFGVEQSDETDHWNAIGDAIAVANCWYAQSFVMEIVSVGIWEADQFVVSSRSLWTLNADAGPIIATATEDV